MNISEEGLFTGEGVGSHLHEAIQFYGDGREIINIYATTGHEDYNHIIILDDALKLNTQYGAAFNIKHAVVDFLPENLAILTNIYMRMYCIQHETEFLLFREFSTQISSHVRVMEALRPVIPENNYSFFINMR